jgi:hypothetical protein
LAAWFVAETRLDWQTRFPADPALLAHYETDVLPLLSVSNVYTMQYHKLHLASFV